MKIINLLYSKYGLSVSICIISCFIIFFIFSLINYLNEDYTFSTIINISVLNSLQILVHVSAFLFLISVILLSIFLRSKNEIVIIKSYVSFKKLIVFFLPIILLFTILEINKKSLATFIENIKSNLLDINNNSVIKIIINNDNETETFTVFNNINGANLESTEYRFYEISNNKIIEAQFSDDLFISNNKIIANYYTKYNKNIIEDIYSKKIFEVNFSDLLNYNFIIKDIPDRKFFFKTIHINLNIFYMLLFTFIFLTFFNRKYVNNKQSLAYPVLICLLFLVYSFLVFSSTLIIFKQLFELLACIITSMFILKVSLHE